MENKSFCKTLKMLRKEYKISQYLVEKNTNIDRTTISAYENGTRDPSYKNLLILADFFKVSLDFLCGRSDHIILDITNENTITQKKIIALLNYTEEVHNQL